ncbi:pyruvate kinase [Nocardioides sp. GY 10113]|uniref:PEP/pyruvate-binding domain-containing protein n=1 Tax=Nocardioides sp. GY 10113 TaxID=2569761 RepID=UPI0010A7CB38|nr:PEP/pyruvate-binding domain-containing protein [Nocardioides sp. GY 10113]TIC87753.1 pyruvate kinase [Nocardioides sp. GY 10113]
MSRAVTGVVALSDADQSHGGKAAALGTLARAGFAVPDGVVIPGPRVDAWRDVRTEDLEDRLADVAPGPYAVRSSSNAEDGPDASFAGQFHTSLNVPAGPALIDAVARTAASLEAAAPAAYAARLGHPAEQNIAVIVQRMVATHLAGVMFTRHPVTGTDRCVIEAIRGLGDTVVDGSSTPERWTVGTDADVTVDRPGDMPPVLTERQAHELVALGRRIEALFGSPQDIEWAIADGRTWILQSRPVTDAGPQAIPSEDTVIDPDRVLVTGSPASPGRAVGTARVIADLDQFGHFQPGDVLVCQTTSPAWTPLLASASAVVTEIGGILSHAAIVAREFGIPAVVAAPGAMGRLSGHDRVHVDGSTGVVSVVRASGETR